MARLDVASDFDDGLAVAAHDFGRRADLGPESAERIEYSSGSPTGHDLALKRSVRN